MLLETIGRAVTAGEPVSADDFRSLGKILETAIDQTRSLSQRYRPLNLEGAGLMKALQDLANASSHCVFQCEKAVFVPGKDQALALFRVAQEAVKNAVQHSSAKRIRILLYHLDSAVILKVKDNGVGYVAGGGEFGSGGIGIMRCRATAAGGELQVRARLNQLTSTLDN
jgi:signal transduction histidine kinase